MMRKTVLKMKNEILRILKNFGLISIENYCVRSRTYGYVYITAGFQNNLQKIKCA